MDELSAHQFADIALALHDEPDTEQTLDRVIDYAQHATACDEAGLMLVHGQGRLDVASATSERVAKIDHLQRELDEGPGLQVLRGHPSFLVDDTASDERWPEWGPRAAALGLRSLLCIRLFTLHTTLGVLNLYGRDAGAFDDDDLDIADIYGRHAAVALASAREEEGLRVAIGARHLVGQAQGILMERYGLDAERAFAVLRRYSRDNNVKLRVIAERIISTRRLPDEP